MPGIAKTEETGASDSIFAESGDKASLFLDCKVAQPTDGLAARGHPTRSELGIPDHHRPGDV